jgi:sulfotransferase family protein
MTGTRQLGSSAAPALSSGLSWYKVLRLGLLGLASDMRDRQREPALRKHPSVCALDPRLHRPVFIIGAPRSGTTFLGSCLGRMPEISYHFEPRLTKAAAQYVYDGTWSERRSAALFRASYRALVLAALDGGRRFADKNPENSFLVPFLAATFPAAQFVHIVRDGRDAAVSHAEKPWLAAASAGSGRVGHAGQSFGPQARWWVEPQRREEFATVPDIVRTAWCWRRFTESALDGLGRLPPGRVVEVRYEAIATVPMTMANVLGEFLGTSPAGLEALRDGLAGANPDSVGRWRKELSETQAAEVEHEIGPLLTKLGYS